jgi:TolB-like protein
MVNLIFFYKNVSAENLLRVLVLPFNIHSEKDLSFLQKGIEDMLSSRLTIEDKVVLISREETRKAVKETTEPITGETALSLAKILNADYILIGSLTVFGESVSTDARFIDVHQNKPVVTFNQVAKSRDDVISHINLFAGQINEKVFGRKILTYQEVTPPTETKDDTRRHPETLLAGGKNTSAEATGPSPQLVASAKAGVDKSGSPKMDVWKSRVFNTQMKGMAVGDVDGDGRNETVFISNKVVFIYRYSDGRFERIGEIEGSNFNEYLGVDIADINKNGKSEIFITSLSSSMNRLESFVLEWNGAQFIKIEDKANWYFRVLNVPERGGNFLLGQKRGIEEVFKRNGVYELVWENGRYVPDQRHDLPKNMNIYGFTYGNVLNDGREMMVAFASSDHIRILDKNGNEEWKSEERFGGSTTYLESPYDADQGEPPSERLKEHYYLPQRIHITDLDKDGKNEIVVVKNKSSTGRLFSRVRIFKGGHIEALDIDELGSSLKWKTRDISGHISDYTIADIDNDEQDELVFAVVSKTGSALGKAKSFLVSQNIFNLN